MALLIDQFTLAQDATFNQRVEQAVVETAVAIAGEAETAAYHIPRAAFAANVLASPSAYASAFAKAVAADDTVATAAGSPPVQANVTDAQITNAVSAAWNALAGARV